MKKLTLIHRYLLVPCALLTLSLCAVAQAGGPPLEETTLGRGITLYKAGAYEDALEVLQKATEQSPNDAKTNMWLGLALEANKQPYAAMEAWRKGYGNPIWEPVADYLKAMSWWRMGDTRSAVAYFNDALLNIQDGKAVNFKPAREAIKLVNAGASVPPLSQWADMSTLTAPVPAPEPVVIAPAAPVKPAANTPPTKPAPAKAAEAKEPAPVAAMPSGAAPSPGKWVATISNGYKGDVLTFRVSADGKRVEDVAFKGHWRSKSWRTEVLEHLDPPKPFTVSKGAFSAVQTESKAGMWWEFIGLFKSAATAEGSYRCTFAGGENDTFKLKWTARRVGP